MNEEEVDYTSPALGIVDIRLEESIVKASSEIKMVKL